MASVDRTTRFEAVIIGGGRPASRPDITSPDAACASSILDEGDRAGASWRRRWDGLRLFTPARFNSLPGMPFPAPAHSLPTKDEVADYLESYAADMGLPIRTGVRVIGLWRNESGDGFRIAAGEHHFEADEVVVASGAYQQPRVPSFAAELPSTIRQLHSKDYRNDSQLIDGPVLVVGASNSGAEIAMDAARHHRTVLSGPDKGKMPIRPESRAARVFDTFFWFFINRVATLDTPIGRKAPPVRARSRRAARADLARGPRGSRRGARPREDGQRPAGPPRARGWTNSRRDQCRLVYRLPARIRVDSHARHRRGWLADADAGCRSPCARSLLRGVTVPLFGCLGTARRRRQGCCLHRRQDRREDEHVAGGTTKEVCRRFRLTPVSSALEHERQATAFEPSVTSPLCAANAASTSSVSRWGTLKNSRLGLSSAATSSNSSGAM